MNSHESAFIKRYGYKTLWQDLSGARPLVLLRSTAGFYKVVYGSQHSNGLDLNQALLIIRSLAENAEKLASLETVLRASLILA
jgi:hypothetical protein